LDEDVTIRSVCSCERSACEHAVAVAVVFRAAIGDRMQVPFAQPGDRRFAESGWRNSGGAGRPRPDVDARAMARNARAVRPSRAPAIAVQRGRAIRAGRGRRGAALA
jgi:hypothetical protein